MEELAQIVVFLIAGAVYLFAQIEKQKKAKQRQDEARKPKQVPRVPKQSGSGGRRPTQSREQLSPIEVVKRHVAQGQIPVRVTNVHGPKRTEDPAEWREPVKPKPHPVQRRDKRAAAPSKQKGDFLVFNDNALMKAIVLSEILQPPLAKRVPRQAGFSR